MMHPKVTNGGEGLQICRVAATTSGSQSPWHCCPKVVNGGEGLQT